MKKDITSISINVQIPEVAQEIALPAWYYCLFFKSSSYQLKSLTQFTVKLLHLIKKPTIRYNFVPYGMKLALSCMV